MTAIKVEASIVHMHDVAVELEPICQHFATRWTPPPSLHRSLKRYVNIASAKQPISLGALRLDRNKKMRRQTVLLRRTTGKLVCWHSGPRHFLENERLGVWGPKFATDPMAHGKPVQFLQHRAYMVKLAPFRYEPDCIILAAMKLVDVALFCSI